MTRIESVTVASFRPWPSWHQIRPPPTSRGLYSESFAAVHMIFCLCNYPLTLPQPPPCPKHSGNIPAVYDVLAADRPGWG